MFAALALTVLASSAALFVRADPDPTNPGPGDVFVEGQPCSITWNPDTTGVWKTMTIQLMTGNNFDMVNLTAVATVDGTDATKTSFSYTCPQVTPHSPIYFYQFSSAASVNGSVWTGRFTITDKVNDIVPATESTQPDGSVIPWGTGQLVKSTTTASAGTTSSAPATGAALGTPSATSSDSVSNEYRCITTSIVTVTPTATSSTGSQATGGGLALSAQSIGWKTASTLGVAALGFALVL
ncbi:uncharacterized protein EDB91DRAFT_1056012 [Suillus paluster]|uniref:uncharacterized protein n=1 Tax=Suillus paluster TaxID=48578 RepID=UPI001B85CF50|nr:uncharacterized protein EDB91DRAFT_1056012 [Suillus paluster]KAG1735919.1 hypothetical protein EDB91DRAFT_1056012 [Suillus paluster]